MKDFSEVKKYLNSSFINRKDLIDGLFIGLLCRKNVFTFGPPGTGKSKLVNEFSSLVEDSGYFYKLMSSFSNPQELLGSLDMKALEEGVQRHDTTKMLPECRIAFLDEIFKSNSGCLNTLLDIANERSFRNGREIQSVKTEMIIGASNECPDDESLVAFYDRFPLRYTVGYLNKGNSFKKLLRAEEKNRPTPISNETIKAAREQMDSISITETVVDAVDALRTYLNIEGYGMSDRSWRISIDFLRASAVLNGRTKINMDDFNVYHHMVWHDPSHESVLKSKISGFQKSNSFMFVSLDTNIQHHGVTMAPNTVTIGSINSAMTRLQNTARNSSNKNTQRSTVEKIQKDLSAVYRHLNPYLKDKAIEYVKIINDNLASKGRESEKINLPEENTEEASIL